MGRRGVQGAKPREIASDSKPPSCAPAMRLGAANRYELNELTRVAPTKVGAVESESNGRPNEMAPNRSTEVRPEYSDGGCHPGLDSRPHWSEHRHAIAPIRDQQIAWGCGGGRRAKGGEAEGQYQGPLHGCEPRRFPLVELLDHLDRVRTAVAEQHQARHVGVCLGFRSVLWS